MSRAPYNTSADVFAGSGTGTPYGYRGTLTGRLVDITRQPTQRPSVLHFDAYFTWSGFALTVGADLTVWPVISVDLSTADILEIPPGSTNYWTVYKTEFVSPRRSGSSPYRRAYLINVLI